MAWGINRRLSFPARDYKPRRNARKKKPVPERTEQERSEAKAKIDKFVWDVAKRSLLLPLEMDTWHEIELTEKQRNFFYAVGVDAFATRRQSDVGLSSDTFHGMIYLRGCKLGEIFTQDIPEGESRSGEFLFWIFSFKRKQLRVSKQNLTARREPRST